MAKDFNLSVVIMAFNEEDNLPVAAQQAIEFLREACDDWQLVIVNDGSSDATGKVADRLARADSEHIDVVHHPTNQGMGAAIRHGYARARCDWVTQLPADCQVHPSMLHRFFPHFGEADLILSVYAKRDDGLNRKILSAGFQAVVRSLLGHRGDFTGTMMFRRQVLERVGDIQSDTFFANMEFPIMALRAGVPHAIVEIEALPRRSGESKVKNIRRMSRVLREIVTLRIRLWRGAP